MIRFNCNIIKETYLKPEGKEFIEAVFSGYSKDDFEEKKYKKWFAKLEKKELRGYYNNLIILDQASGFKYVNIIIDENRKLKEIIPGNPNSAFWDDILFAFALSIVIEKGELELCFCNEDTREEWFYIIEPDRVESIDINKNIGDFVVNF